jgi:hypothetical protein
MLDPRVSSMVYGRPVCIVPQRLPTLAEQFPSTVDDRFIAQNTLHPASIPSINAFFVSVVRLYHLMDNILDSLHSRSSGGGFLCRTNADQSIPDCQSFCTYCAMSQLPAVLQLDALRFLFLLQDSTSRRWPRKHVAQMAPFVLERVQDGGWGEQPRWLF